MIIRANFMTKIIEALQTLKTRSATVSWTSWRQKALELIIAVVEERVVVSLIEHDNGGIMFKELQVTSYSNVAQLR